MRTDGYNLLVGKIPDTKVAKKAAAAKKVKMAKKTEGAIARKIKKAEAAAAKKVKMTKKAKTSNEAKQVRNVGVKPIAVLQIPKYEYVTPDPSLNLTEEEVIRHKQTAVGERNRYMILKLEKARNELNKKEECMRLKGVTNGYADLDGYQFEVYLKNHFLDDGYEVQHTKASGDYGVDLIILKDKRKIAIQVKKYSGPVGMKAVQEVFSGKAHYKCSEAWVITNSKYTPQAVKMARSCGVRLITGSELNELLEIIISKK